MKRLAFSVAVAAAAAVLWASAAGAVTISIGLQEAGVNGGAITTVATGTGSAIIFPAIPYGTFSSVQADGTGNPPLVSPELLDSNTIDVSSSTAGTLNVYVTSQGNPTPNALVSVLSAFTENALTAGWSVVESTYVDLADVVYALTIPLGSHTFTGIGTASAFSSGNPHGATVSFTELYTINASGSGQDNSTIDLSTVPLPGTLILFAGGLGLLGIAGRRRRKKQPRSLAYTEVAGA